MSELILAALAIDLTGRNVQDAVKKKGLPWSTAKGFDTFCPVGYVLELEMPADDVVDSLQTFHPKVQDRLGRRCRSFIHSQWST